IGLRTIAIGLRRQSTHVAAQGRAVDDLVELEGYLRHACRSGAVCRCGGVYSAIFHAWVWGLPVGKPQLLTSTRPEQSHIGLQERIAPHSIPLRGPPLPRSAGRGIAYGLFLRLRRTPTPSPSPKG